MPKPNPIAEELLRRLGVLLDLAANSFKDPGDLTFPKELLTIPTVIIDLMPFVERKQVPRIPFWRCIETLDRRKKRLGLIKKLDLMVENASKIKPGPFVRLINEYRDGVLPESSKPLLIELDRYLYRAPEDLEGNEIDPDARWRALPEDLRHFVPLLERTVSPAFAQHGGARSPGVFACAEAWAYMAFLDLVWQNRQWNNRYWDDLSAFADLLKYLHNERYNEVRKRLLYAAQITNEEFAAHYRRNKNAEAKRRVRARKGAQPRSFKKRRPEKPVPIKCALTRNKPQA